MVFMEDHKPEGIRVVEMGLPPSEYSIQEKHDVHVEAESGVQHRAGGDF